MKLELGSGSHPDSRFDVHIDIDIQHHPDAVADALHLPFVDEIFEEVRVVDVLEHISYRETLQACREWARVLCSGGRIYIQVPDAMTAIRWHLDGRRIDRSCLDSPPLVGLSWILMGGHFDEEYASSPENWRYNAHYALFDEPTLRWYLAQAGLTVTSMTINAHPNLLCWAVKP